MKTVPLLWLTLLIFCGCNKKHIVATPPNPKQVTTARLAEICSPGFEKLVFADQDQQTLYKFRCLWALEIVEDKKTLKLWILDIDQEVRVEAKAILDKLEADVK